MNFIINNQEKFQTNSSILSFNTRNKHYLHRPNNNRSFFPKTNILSWHKNFQLFVTESDIPQELSGKI